MRKQIYWVFAVSGVLFFMFSIFNSCLQEETFAKATVETSQATSITEATVTCGGIITADGGSDVTTRGVCWSVLPTPTIENDTTIAATGSLAFTSSIKGLSPGTTYYVRAYAVNKGGVAYGLNVIFTTKTFSITTTPISIALITATSAIGGGNIVSDGDSSSLTVTARGVCWNTFPAPTIENSKTMDGVGGGRFTSTMDSLTVFTTYYVRAYATNGNGTIYGNEVTFTTQSGVVGLATTAAYAITPYTATSGGTISSDGGAAVTACGVCWNTSSAPTIDNLKTSDGSGSGTFTSSITGLTHGTTYYVRSYATNSFGTTYGNEVTFTTQSGLVGLTTTAVYAITPYEATSGGTISSDGCATVTERGVCWNTTSAPTIANSKVVNGFLNDTYSSRLTGLTPCTTYYVRAYATNSVGTAYGNQVNFTSSGTITDIDGNVYYTVKIGTQVWMAENLKTTKYNDGTSIPYVTVNFDWLTLSTPGYCFYSNDAARYKDRFGALYNWYTVNTGKLAPTGWHVPTDAEWTTLENYLIANGYNYDGTTTGNKIAKSLAATEGWNTHSYIGAVGNDLTKNNTSGFAGLSGANRYDDGTFGNISLNGYWWSSTEYSTTTAWSRYLDFSISYVLRNSYKKQYGFSVRCVRDY